MARISGVDIPNAKRVEVALTYIYGIGPKSAKNILAATGINPDTRAKDLTEDDIAKLRDEIENHYTVEGELRREVALNIKRLVEINATAESDTEKVFLFADREQRPMREQEKVPQRQSQIRRSKRSERI